MVIGSKFKVLCSIALCLGFLTSCVDSNDANSQGSTGLVTIPERVEIGNTGYSIKLIDGYYIEPDTLFDAYYFKPVISGDGESEAGFYLGPRPDTGAPLIEYTRKTARDTFMNDSVTWIEYTTANYTQREVFIDKSADKKIHIWCYSRNAADVERLYQMVRSIR